ncbi:MAG: hypothetical protein V3V33_13150 [Candidatus Lokiarchaeia archaeon]
MKVKLEDIIQKISQIPTENCYLIIIDEDLSEAFYKKSKLGNNTELETLIRKNFGFCFNIQNDKYFLWKYNPTDGSYELFEKTGKVKLISHKKLSHEFDFIKI